MEIKMQEMLEKKDKEILEMKDKMNNMEDSIKDLIREVEKLKTQLKDKKEDDDKEKEEPKLMLMDYKKNRKRNPYFSSYSIKE